MKWFFTLTDISPTFSQDVKLAKVAIYTAKKNTALESICLYDGIENEFTQWLEGEGVKVIQWKTPHYEQLKAIGKKELQIGALAFLSIEIPQVMANMGWDDEKVLYTDITVIFLKDVVKELQSEECNYLAVARGEFNLGVMLINAPKMSLIYEKFNKYIGENLEQLVKQGYQVGAYKKYFQGQWDELEKTINWQCYWEVNSKAKIVNFNGVRPDKIPATIAQLQSGKLPYKFINQVNYNYLKYGQIWLEFDREISSKEELTEVESKLLYIHQQLVKGMVEVKEIELNQEIEETLWKFALDYPKPGTKLIVDAVVISGWVLGKQSSAKTVEFLVEEEVIATTEIIIQRPDVGKIYTSVSGAEKSGFFLALEFESEVELEIVVVLEDESRVILGKVKLDFIAFEEEVGYSEFNWQLYVEYNKDLSDFSPVEAYSHWLRAGKKAGRVGTIARLVQVYGRKLEDIPRNFDWQEYLDVNPDLKREIDSRWKAIQHFIALGINKERRYRLPAKFELEEVKFNEKKGKKSSGKVSIIVYVNQQLKEVKNCLESLMKYTKHPYSLTIVNDGSNEKTSDYLEKFAETQGDIYIYNKKQSGYFLVIQEEIKQAQGDYIIILQANIILTPNWLERMIACGESREKIGIVGALSNQQLGEFLPEMSLVEQGRMVARYAGKLYPQTSNLDNSCLLIKREMLAEVSAFDDYEKVIQSGWELALADDCYIYHQKAEPEKQVKEEDDLILAGIIARAQGMSKRQKLIEQGKILWEGKRVFFILPIPDIGGGANMVLQEAKIMQKMGVDARIINFKGNQTLFEINHPGLEIPVIYVDSQWAIANLLPKCDAVVATLYASVYWMEKNSQTVRGYYIQDFEPYFFPENSEEYKLAWKSYTQYPDLVRIAKTKWNGGLIKEKIGVECWINGPSIDIDLFRPRKSKAINIPENPIRILAMIRPKTPRRAPQLTMEILWELDKIVGEKVEIILFGCESDDPEFAKLPQNFPCYNAGVLTRRQTAALMNEVDIFADFSTFQALGLTAMEAMCCGVAVIVPEKGGANSFVQDEVNGLIVDSSSKDACLTALMRLVDDEELRLKIGRQALIDVCQYFPEKSAFKTLKALFKRSKGQGA